MAQIILIPLGSAGDVHPFLGLGQLLQHQGHQVVIATNPHFKPHVQRLNLEFVGIGTEQEFESVVQDPKLWHPFFGFFRVARWGMLHTMREIYDLLQTRHVPGETVVVAPITAIGARIAQDKLGIPLVTVVLQPMLMRSIFESPRIPYSLMGDRVPHWYKRFQYWVFDMLISDRTLASPINQFRSELNLSPVRNILKKWCYSPLRTVGLFPDWFAKPQPDWPTQNVTTGFPLWDDQDLCELPRQARDFLAAGAPPIVFTPGSAMAHGQGFFRQSISACLKLGQRGLLLTRFPQNLPTEFPEQFAHFPYIPFGKLLPRSAALVHHGGIGTTAQAIAAGIPQLIMPMAYDQFDNAFRIRQLGLGTSIRRASYRCDAVAERLRQIESNDIRARCQRFAEYCDGRRAIEQTAEVVISALNLQNA